MATGVSRNLEPLIKSSSADIKKTAFTDLSVDILAVITSHVRNSDLVAFAGVGKVYTELALREKLVRILSESQKKLKEILSLNPPLVISDSPSITLYVNLFKGYVHTSDFISAADQNLEHLNQFLTDLKTHQTMKAIFRLKEEFNTEVQQGLVHWDNLHNFGARLEETVVQIALEKIILSSQDPVAVRSSCVIEAADQGCMTLVTGLLASGEITNLARDTALLFGARKGFLEIVKSVLASGQTSLDFRKTAMTDATRAGHEEIAQLLENLTIHQ